MTLREFYLKRAKAEIPVFLNVLRALPKDLSYKPHDRSPSAEQLAWTLTYEMKALIDVVNTGKSEWENITPPGLDEMIAMYETGRPSYLRRSLHLMLHPRRGTHSFFTRDRS